LQFHKSIFFVSWYWFGYNSKKLLCHQNFGQLLDSESSSG
jgi:hypothetical protein